MASHDITMQLQQKEQGQQQVEKPTDSLQAEPLKQAARLERPTRPERVLSPELLAFIASCLLAGVSLFMLGRIIRQRFTLAKGG